MSEDEKAMKEVLEFLEKLPLPEMPASSNECVEACKKSYNACMERAGDSTAAKAVCNTRYRNCLVGC